MTDAPAPKDYKNTVFLPQTAFPMKAGLAEAEPKWLDYWDSIDLYGKIRAASQGRPTFVLHDGPPYANNIVHVGTCLTKILKDGIVRSHQLLGYDAPWVPGWDCHGLPIEWEIEKKYRAAKKNMDAKEHPLEFRAECRAFAEHWVDVQMATFKRTGALADWKNPYLTMTPDADATIVREIHRFLNNGALYRGVRPTLWSTVEQTAFAEAEVEYHDHTSNTLTVAFPVVKASTFDLKDAHIVIWTTTPWTLPANRAIAYGNEIDYVVVQAADKKYVVAEALLENFIKAAALESHSVITTITGDKLAGTICAHPLRGADDGRGYNFDVPLLAGDFVTTEAGTGFVHIAPSHGDDDFRLGKAHNIDVPDWVQNDGTYAPEVPLFAGLAVYMPDGKTGPANKAVADAIRARGLLLAEQKLVHSYPHSWRSKAPLIYRVTPQWFVSMEKTGLRQTALQAIADTNFVPEQGRNRIGAMVAGRGDWCISRQRTWGVPLALFTDKKTKEPLRDAEVSQRIEDTFRAEGSDAWYARPAQYFLGDKYKAEDFDQIMDTVDVWVDSASTHAFVLEPKGLWPADVYCEGSDQHRGWFQSSLLVSCNMAGRAPYKTIVTNGFVLDGKGYKMSKSLGNFISGDDGIKAMGADILRLWVFSSTYTEDMKFSIEGLKQPAETYRRLRNTLRYILGGLHGFTDAEKLPVSDLPELEQYILHHIQHVDAELRACIKRYDLTSAVQLLNTFCNNDLSAFYFDVRKDALYCDAPDSLRRRACRTVLDILYDCLTAWLAPFLCFTAEEAWHARTDGRGKTDAVPSVHLRTFPTIPAAWQNDTLAKKWATVRDLRRVVTGALELRRADKTLGSSLQAAPTLFVSAVQAAALTGIDMAEVTITSALHIKTGTAPVDAFTLDDVKEAGCLVAVADGHKCERCWQHLPEVGTHADHPGLCHRCHNVVTNPRQVAA